MTTPRPGIDQELGSCCGCGRTNGVRNVVLLNVVGPVPGTGWGCLQCGLPADGAVAVLCDDCAERLGPGFDGLRFICEGYPKDDKRIAYTGGGERFDHDLSRHPELQSREYPESAAAREDGSSR